MPTRLTAPAPPAPVQATRLGHRPVWDPPSHMSAAERWTCDCGHAVLRYGRNVYGSATELPCPLNVTGGNEA